MYRAGYVMDDIDIKTSLKAGSIWHKVPKKLVGLNYSGGFDLHVKNEASEIIDRLKVILHQGVFFVWGMMLWVIGAFYTRYTYISLLEFNAFSSESNSFQGTTFQGKFKTSQILLGNL